jgi:RNA polymerase sigma-70 factor (ECF subfamily)
MPDPDILVWSKVQAGDEDAFKFLFLKHYQVLCLLSKQYTHDMTTAREVLQDIFIYLWENRQELNIHTSFKSYLSQAVRFNSIRRLNNDKKAGIRMDIVPEPDNNNEFYDFLEYAELQKNILEAVESLPDQCRKVFSLSRFESLSYNEIAKSLNLSVKTVEAHISKALRIIQDHLNKTVVALFVFQIDKYL